MGQVGGQLNKKVYPMIQPRDGGVISVLPSDRSVILSGDIKMSVSSFQDEHVIMSGAARSSCSSSV